MSDKLPGILLYILVFVWIPCFKVFTNLVLFLTSSRSFLVLNVRASSFRYIASVPCTSFLMDLCKVAIREPPQTMCLQLLCIPYQFRNISTESRETFLPAATERMIHLNGPTELRFFIWNTALFVFLSYIYPESVLTSSSFQ